MDNLTGANQMEQLTESYKWEILKMARDLVINEYTDQRAQLHNEWVSKSQLFNKSGVMIPYPAIPPYPTESEILTRAQLLLNFLNTGQVTADFVDGPTQSTTEEDSTLTAFAIDDADRSVKDLQPQQLKEMPEQLPVDLIDRTSVDNTEKKSVISEDKLVPSLMERLGQIRKSWN